MTRAVWITGIGVASSAGEGVEAHLAALSRPPVVDETRFPGYAVHPCVSLDLDRQIPKKSDQRQMEAWQRIGVYAAGLALDSAGLKGDKERLAQTQTIVASGGGERDTAVDGYILSKMRHASSPGAFLNERLMSDLRPTLFLAQLSNLLAGNIAIVHGVTGASRTFMGEEQAGVDALRIAHARIAAGQAETMLVGGSYNAERPDTLVIYEMGGFLWKQPFRSVWDRGTEGGFIPGSAGAFLVLEAEEVARARGARPLARLEGVASAQDRRKDGSIVQSLTRLSHAIGDTPQANVVVSGASGVTAATTQEQEAIRHCAPDATVYATGDIAGHTFESQFPLSVALAASLLDWKRAENALVTGVGRWRGEGLARLSRVEGV